MGDVTGSGNRKIVEIDTDKEDIISKYLIAYGELISEVSIRSLKRKTGTEKSAGFLNPLKDLITQFEDLITESENKISSWGTEKKKAVAREEFKSAIAHAKSDTLPDFRKKLDEVRVAAALGNMFVFYDSTVRSSVERAGETLIRARELIETDPSAASSEQGKGYSALKKSYKDVFGEGIARHAKRFCDIFECGSSVRDIIDNSDISELIISFQTRHTNTKLGFDALNNAIDDYFDNIENIEPTTTSTDPTYILNLKKSIRNFNSVVTFAKQGYEESCRMLQNCERFSQVIEQTVQSNAAAAVISIRTLYNNLKDKFNEVDGHIQDKIRKNDESEYSVIARDDGITSEDRGTSLRPLSSRSFSFNYQTNLNFTEGTKILIGYLQELINKFDVPEAIELLEEING